MKNLRVESTSISWDFNEATVSINEGYLIKGTQYIASEKLLLVLAGERGVVQNLLAYNEDGSLKFSLYPPQGESMSVHFLNDTFPSPASNTVSK